jgi:hypothetical protein
VMSSPQRDLMIAMTKHNRKSDRLSGKPLR